MVDIKARSQKNTLLSSRKYWRFKTHPATKSPIKPFLGKNWAFTVVGNCKEVLHYRFQCEPVSRLLCCVC